MRTLLVFLLLTLPLLAQDAPFLKTIDWSQLDDGTWKGRVTLTGPAPAGGAQVIFEPTFHFELPGSVTVPAGQSTAEFPLKLVDNAFITGFTGLPEAGLGRMHNVTAFCSGRLWEGPGPDRSRF